jgi:transposase
MVELPMYGRERRVLLRHYLEQGLSKAEIARMLRVSRQTLYHWINGEQLDRDLDNGPVRYTPRPPVARKIDRYREMIQVRLAEYPRLSATRLFEEVRAAGYGGGYTQLKEFVREVRPGPPEDPVVRFETPPGLQAQVDFAEFRLPWGKRFALLVVMGYSRLMWLQFYPRQTLMVLIRGLEEAFAAFGGVPAELLFDQMKAVIIEDHREVGGKLLENIEFVRFAAHWNFRIRACRPYRARTKGKVERPIRFVRESFFYGREFLNDADLNQQALSWVTRKANLRIHRTTLEVPQIRFDRDERAVLHVLAPRPYRPVVQIPPGRGQQNNRANLPSVERRALSVYSRITGARA